MTKMWLANWLPQLNHFREVNENRSLQHACQYKDLAHADIFQDASSYSELLVILMPRRLTCNHDINMSSMSILNQVVAYAVPVINLSRSSSFLIFTMPKST